MYSQNIFASIYTDSEGRHIDPLKPGADKLFVVKNQYDYITQATHDDDGVVIGLAVPIKDPDTHEAFKASAGPKPYTFGISTDPNYLQLSTKNTPAYENLYNLYLNGQSFLKVRTNFTLNSGDISSAVCSLKQSSSLWDIKWTGVPVIDKFVCESGKKFYSIAVDMIIECSKTSRADFYFDWDLNFTTPFLSVWNFVVQTTIEIINAPYINLSMIPWVTTYSENKKYEQRMKRNVRPIELPETNKTAEFDNSCPQTAELPERYLYPVLPTAPPMQDDYKRKPSIFKRMFGKKGSKVHSDTNKPQ